MQSQIVVNADLKSKGLLSFALKELSHKAKGQELITWNKKYSAFWLCKEAYNPMLY